MQTISKIDWTSKAISKWLPNQNKILVILDNNKIRHMKEEKPLEDLDLTIEMIWSVYTINGATAIAIEVTIEINPIFFSFVLRLIMKGKGAYERRFW